MSAAYARLLQKVLRACTPGSSAVAGTSAPATMNVLLHLTICHCVRPTITCPEVAASGSQGQKLVGID